MRIKKIPITLRRRGDVIYPKTVAKQIVFEDGKNLEEKWAELEGGGDAGGNDAEKYLTLEALTDGVKVAAISTQSVGGLFEWSVNGVDWTEAQAINNSGGGELSDYAFTTLNKGDKVCLRSTGGSATRPKNRFLVNCSFFVSAATAAYGNVMSMLYGADFKGQTAITTSLLTCLFSDFGEVFTENYITNDPKGRRLVMPATTMPYGCYLNMFKGCTSLTQAPELPATTLADACYSSMFEGCTSLTQAPELPATTLTRSCYSSMFKGCTSLTQAPELPATTLTYACYTGMFEGCTSLTQAPDLPATLKSGECYYEMFKDCSALNYIRCFTSGADSDNLDSSFTSWVDGVAPTGTFVKAAGISWPTGTSGIPSGWTVVEE